MSDLDDVPTPELMRRVEAAAENDPTREGEERWELVRALRARGGRDVLQAAIAWTRSPKPLLRCLGADVLAQLGQLGRNLKFPFAAESAAPLVELFADAEEYVICAALVALGHLDAGDDATISALAGHPSADVRYSVAWALSLREEPISCATKIALSTDVDDEVRNWATFGLGQCEVDTPEIREALAARIDDSFEEVRWEAMFGLAARKDRRAVPLILHELEQDEVLTKAIEAAAELPDPSFVPHLEELLDANPEDEELRALIERCRGS